MNVIIIVKAPIKELRSSRARSPLFSSIIHDNTMWKNLILRDYPSVDPLFLAPFYDYNYLFIYRTLQNYSLEPVNFTINSAVNSSVNSGEPVNSTLNFVWSLTSHELNKIIKEDDVYTFKYFLFINKNNELLIINKTYALMTYSNFDIYQYLLINYPLVTIPRDNYALGELYLSVTCALKNIQQAHKVFLLKQINISKYESDIHKLNQIHTIVNLYIEKYCNNISILR